MSTLSRMSLLAVCVLLLQGAVGARERGDPAAPKVTGPQEVDVVALATSAIREAPNRRHFISEVRKTAGITLRVITGEEEADYIYRAVRSAVDFHGGTALCIDVGGGSVEMIVGTSSEVFFTRSEPAGARIEKEKRDIFWFVVATIISLVLAALAVWRAK